MTGSPGVFNSESCPHWASRNSSVKTVQVLLPRHCSLCCFGCFCLWVPAVVSCQCTSPASLSNLGSSHLPCVLPSVMNSRRVVDFSVCSAFYLWLGWNSDFQAPYMHSQKPNVLNFFFNEFFSGKFLITDWYLSAIQHDFVPPSPTS